ncbi:MAG: hypothetical protein V2G48_05110 [bacterium JZ-2024 1]
MKASPRSGWLLHFLLILFSLIFSYFLAGFWRDILIQRYQKVHPPGNPSEKPSVRASPADDLQKRIDEHLKELTEAKEKAEKKTTKQGGEKNE